MGVQEVRWGKGRTKSASKNAFFCWEGNVNNEIGSFIHNINILAVKRVEFVIDRASYIILRGIWCDIIVLNIDVPTEDKTDYKKNSFYEEL
jgi:hypothetical protein